MSVRRSHRGAWMVDIKGFRHPDGRVEPRIRLKSPIQTRRGAEQFERQVRQALQDGPRTFEEQQRAWHAAAEQPRQWVYPQPSRRVRIIE